MHHSNIEQSLAQAQQASAGGDLASAIRFIGDALALEPSHGPALQAAYSVLARMPNAVAMTSPRPDTTPAMQAMHALALAMAHNWTPALEILFELCVANTSTPYLAWALQWMHQHPSAVLFDMSVVGSAIAGFADAYEDPIDPDDPAWATLQAGTTVVGKLATSFSDNGPLTVVWCKLLRRGKAYDASLAVAAQTKARDRKLGAMLAAFAYRDMALPAQTILAFREALAFGHDDGIVLDIGDTQWADAQFEAAADTYRQISEQSDCMPYAYASNVAARYMSTKSPQLLAELIQLAGHDNERAQRLVQLLQSYSEAAGRPRDLICGVVRDLQSAFAKAPQGTPEKPAAIAIALTSLESPSALIALRVAAAMGQSHVRMTITPEKKASPDPAYPLLQALGGAVDPIVEQFPLWRLEEGRPVPNMPQPQAHVQQAIAGIVGMKFDLQTWLTTLNYMGPSFAGQLPAILSALLHPSLPPHPNFDAVDWTWRWQIATALLISKLDSGWQGSHRRLGLLAMAHGPVDWVVGASIVAFGQVFAECPDSRMEIAQLFEALRRRTPNIGYCAYTAVLEATTMRLPGLDETNRRAAFRRLVQIEKKPYLG